MMNIIARQVVNCSNLATINYSSRGICRNFTLTSVYRCESRGNPEESGEKIDTADRTKIIPVETSVKYIKSSAYKTTYGDQPVWVPYRRNFKGQHPPLKTRKTCIRAGKVSTGNPCPICRDEYLVLDHNNVDLLNQFISKHTGEVCVRFYFHYIE